MFGLLCLCFAGYVFANGGAEGHWTPGNGHHGYHEEGPQVQGTQAMRCSNLCSSLRQTYPSQVSYPNSTIYTTEQKYWSLQQSLTEPTCRFTPTCAEEVSYAIFKIREFQCPFAVKSGGHGAFRGASNIHEGITIDLSSLNVIEPNADKTIVRTGTGNRWEDVYAKLDPLGVAVIGGRNGDIGVGGLTLGGGISYFSGFRGWACDNVANYEVVLSNGSIANINQTSAPDLYFALRGGGNNFGVVTCMDLEALPQGQMWGGMKYYPMAANASIIDALYWFNQNAKDDPLAHTYIAAACSKGSPCLFTAGYEYAHPVVAPPVFENFTAVPSTGSSMRITTLSNLTAELKATQPPGFYQAFWTLTVQNDAQLLKDILDKIWYPAIKPLINATDNFLGTLAIQPLTGAIITNFGKNGGNALGVNASQGPLVILNMDFQWSHPEEEAHILAVQQEIIDSARKLSEQRGLSHPYLYQNYAYGSQDVFAGYGSEENREKLLKIQEKYDPEGVLTVLQPGYFKLRKEKRRSVGPECCFC